MPALGVDLTSSALLGFMIAAGGRRSRLGSSGTGAKHIDLSCRGLKAWPADLFTLQTLQQVDISSNGLTFVDGGISRLIQLEEGCRSITSELAGEVSRQCV